MDVVTSQSFMPTIAEKIEQLYKQKATGELKFCDQNKRVAVMFFLGGRVQYMIPLRHRLRHWQRAVSKNCPDWQLPHQMQKTDPWECDFIYQGVSKKHINLDQAKSIVTMITKEALLELALMPQIKIQWQQTDREKSTFSYFLSLAPVDITSLLQEAEKEKKLWQSHKLESLHPCITPTITGQGKKLIKNLLQLKYLDGGYTMWDLAVSSKNSVVTVAKTLQKWHQKQLITFKQLEDLPIIIRDARNLTKAKNSPVVQLVADSKSSTVDSGKKDIQKASLADSHNYLIACIDDSPIIIHTLNKILTKAGFGVLSIEEPMAGFAKLIEEKPDLVILDLNMPNASGYSVCKFLRESPVFENTPIVILTAQDGNIDRVKAKLAGATDFVNKPPEAKTLIPLIKKYLSNQQNARLGS